MLIHCALIYEKKCVKKRQQEEESCFSHMVTSEYLCHTIVHTIINELDQGPLGSLPRGIRHDCLLTNYHHERDPVAAEAAVVVAGVGAVAEVRGRNRHHFQALHCHHCHLVHFDYARRRHHPPALLDC